MKKSKRQRLRLKPHPSTQKQSAAAATEGSGLRVLAWCGCIGVVVLVGYFLIHKPSEPTHPAATIEGQSKQSSATQNSTANAEATAAALTTNRPGAIKNLEAEGSADDLNNAGVQLLDKGDPSRAVSFFQRASALKPDDETFHFNLAVAYAKSGDMTSAEHEYKESLRLLPDYPEANNNYGNLLARTGRLSDAEKHLSEAVSEMPESASYNNSLGVVQQKLRKTNEALLSFQKAVESDTNLLEGHFNLAEAYLARHNREKGIAQLIEVLRIKPDFAPAKRAMAGITAAR
ncbi:MAG TPA: tetratricopeptide repeat protein [Verrucomicrobiae bacterium]|jgi:Flp pilus assembly protein TadD